jgi:hypothetical protein
MALLVGLFEREEQEYIAGSSGFEISGFGVCH